MKGFLRRFTEVKAALCPLPWATSLQLLGLPVCVCVCVCVNTLIWITLSCLVWANKPTAQSHLTVNSGFILLFSKSLKVVNLSYVFPGDVSDVVDILDLSFMSDDTHWDGVLTHLRRHVLVHLKTKVPQNQVAWKQTQTQFERWPAVLHHIQDVSD